MIRVICMLAIVFGSSAQAPGEEAKLVGKWKGSKSSTFEFHGDGTATVTSNGTAIGRVEVTLDPTKTPHWIDLKLSQGGMSMVIPGIYKWVSETEILIETGAPGLRSTAFSKEGESGHQFQEVLIKME